MLPCKGRHFPKAIIQMVVRWYLAYALSYQGIKELMNECEVKVDRLRCPFTGVGWKAFGHNLGGRTALIFVRIRRPTMVAARRFLSLVACCFTLFTKSAL